MEFGSTGVDDGFFVSASEQREWRNFYMGLKQKHNNPGHSRFSGVVVSYRTRPD